MSVANIVKLVSVVRCAGLGGLAGLGLVLASSVGINLAKYALVTGAGFECFARYAVADTVLFLFLK